MGFTDRKRLKSFLSTEIFSFLRQGELAGYEVREYLLEKWGHKCAYYRPVPGRTKRAAKLLVRYG